MLRNYILIIWRTVTRNKVYSFLNILGLTTGITCALVIFLYVSDELTYDRNHAQIENIYRLNGSYHLPNNGAGKIMRCVGRS